MQKALRIPASRLSWLWALLPLLLAAALVAPILGRDVFDNDEAATMIGAGARHLGPFTPCRSGTYLSFTLAGSSLGPRGGLFAVGAYRGLE